jgi:hypothetical protein
MRLQRHAAGRQPAMVRHLLLQLFIGRRQDPVFFFLQKQQPGGRTAASGAWGR